MSPDCPANSPARRKYLQELPAEVLQSLTVNNSLAFSAFSDDLTLASNARADRLAGKTAQMPLLMGTPNDESSPLVYGQTNASAVLELIRLSEYTDILLEAFPLGEPGIKN
jgi:hypothetical protein